MNYQLYTHVQYIIAVVTLALIAELYCTAFLLVQELAALIYSAHCCSSVKPSSADHMECGGRVCNVASEIAIAYLHSLLARFIRAHYAILVQITSTSL